MKMNAILKIGSALLVMALFTIISFSSCQKNDKSASGTKGLQVYLSDGPGIFDKVNIDVTAVEAKIDTSMGHRNDDRHGDDDDDRDDNRRNDDYGFWVNLSAKPGVYDVFSLRNGADTLLGTGNVNGTIRKIRITLGNNNSLVVGGVTYPLVLANETGNFLYVKIREEHHHDSASQSKVWVDFDLARSIYEKNGTFYLKPVLKPFCDQKFASLEGKVLPAAAGVIVKAFIGKDTSTAIPNADGKFKIRGLQSGTYTVWFDANNGYKDTTVNATVNVGRETRIPDITLNK
jgi:hypothetical protein